MTIPECTPVLWLYYGTITSDIGLLSKWVGSATTAVNRSFASTLIDQHIVYLYATEVQKFHFEFIVFSFIPGCGYSTQIWVNVRPWCVPTNALELLSVRKLYGLNRHKLVVSCHAKSRECADSLFEIKEHCVIIGMQAQDFVLLMMSEMQYSWWEMRKQHQKPTDVR